MPKRDSIDKIVGSYFAAITTRSFVYKGHTVDPKPLVVSGALLRGFTCPPACGGCCPTFSLDYLPTEEHPYELAERVVDFDGRHVRVWSDTQDERVTEKRCRNLLPTGRCGIHGKQPFSCDFELIRFTPHGDEWLVSERLFGRGWAMKRTDGGQGALCTITPATVATALDVRRRLLRLCEWADHFGLQHRARLLVEYADLYAHDVDSAPRARL